MAGGLKLKVFPAATVLLTGTMALGELGVLLVVPPPLIVVTEALEPTVLNGNINLTDVALEAVLTT
jgi:hypothetical protein